MIFTNLSGGIDSTNCVYNVLKSGNTKIKVHHCIFATHENRFDAEYKATQNIIKWFKEQGWTKIDYMETAVDLRLTKYSFYDIELFGFLAGGCLRSMAGTDITFMLSTSKDDFAQPQFEIRHNDRLQLIRMMSKMPELQIIIPNEYKSRLEVIKEMPVELVKLCWFCRRPSIVDQKPCGKCKTCMQTLPIFRELGIESL